MNDDAIERAVLIDELLKLRGRLHVTVTPKRRAPAHAHPQQHGYYRAVVQPIVRRFLNETQGGMPDGDGYRDFTEKEAHQWIKEQLASEGVIGVPIVNRHGEQTGFVTPSCADMSAVKMYEFTDAIVARLQREGYRVPPPDKHWREARVQAFAEEQSNRRETVHA